ncbi:MAG: regulatory iron-sulfur-containing complex subunit RicT [Evtepia sp.]
MPDIISVRFRSEGKQYYFDPQGETCRVGDGVIVETAAGKEYAVCVRGNFTLPEEELTAPLRPLLRLATPEDRAVVERNREKEKYAFKVCQEKILDHKLEMKLVNVECNFEGTQHHLLLHVRRPGWASAAWSRASAAVFHTRIELRQIGVRDEAKMLGGLGICGRPLLLLVVFAGLPAGVHQDGQDPEPVPEPHEDLRHLRAAHVLPEI